MSAAESPENAVKHGQERSDVSDFLGAEPPAPRDPTEPYSAD